MKNFKARRDKKYFSKDDVNRYSEHHLCFSCQVGSTFFDNLQFSMFIMVSHFSLSCIYEIHKLLRFFASSENRFLLV